MSENTAIEFTFSGDKHLMLNFLGQHTEHLKQQIISTAYTAFKECYKDYYNIVKENIKINIVIRELLSRHPTLIHEFEDLMKSTEVE